MGLLEFLKRDKKQIEMQQEKINKLLIEKQRLEATVEVLTKEINTYKNKVKDMEEDTKRLSIYKDRFGTVPLIENLSGEGYLTEYDKDKSFFDELEKKKGNPFSNDQVKAIRYPCTKHMRLIAGAGSGKTETICAKAAYLVTMEEVDESKICMITFTKKAAGEMEKRVNEFLGVEKSNISIGTFHRVFIKLFNNLVRQFPELKNHGIHGKDPNEGENESKKILRMLIKKYDLFDFEKSGEKKIEERLSYWLSMGYSLDDIALNIENHFDKEFGYKLSEKFYEMIKEFEKIRKENNIVVYDDYQLNLYNVLKDYPEARSYLQGKYDYIFIDEFQDTNPLQMKIINLLCPTNGSTKTKLIIVGDDDQSIYAFRASDPIYIKNFDQTYETETFELMKNYRSKADIVTAANRLITYNNNNRIIKSMTTFHDNKCEAFTVKLDDIHKEAEWIIEKAEKLGMESVFELKSGDTIKSYMPNYTKSVVIYRSANQLQGIIRALDKKNTPYVIENKDDLLGIFNIYEFKIVFDLWSKLSNEKNSRNLLLVWKDILRNITINYYINKKVSSDYIGTLNTYNLEELINDFMTFIDQNKKFNDIKCVKPYVNLLVQLQEGKDIKITKLLDFLFEFPKIKKEISKEDLDYIYKECENYNTLDELKSYQKRLENKKKEMDDKIKKYFKKEYNALYLLTIHKSKGLSFDNVFVIGCYNNGIPSSKAVDASKVNMDICKQKAEPPATIEEERRLMYVAVTRAVKNVYVTFPCTIHGKPCARSQFIKELGLPFLN